MCSNMELEWKPQGGGILIISSYVGFDRASTVYPPPPKKKKKKYQEYLAPQKYLKFTTPQKYKISSFCTGPQMHRNDP